jgi:hypothetical protein
LQQTCYWQHDYLTAYTDNPNGFFNPYHVGHSWTKAISCHCCWTMCSNNG